MNFSQEEVSKLSQLARLALSPSEAQARQKDLAQILGHVQALQKIDVSGVQPMTHAVPIELHVRADEVKSGLGRKGLEASAGYEDGLVKVPKIIE